MATLRRHATEAPARWKEPGAFPATDHASQRARQGRGRRSIRRRVGGQCDRRDRGAGSLIPHARAIGALVIAMIQAPFRTAAMAAAGRAEAISTGGGATRGRAIRLAAVTRDADGEEPVAASTDLLAERRVHDVGAATRSDWTQRSNRGTRETTGSVRRSIEAVTEGLEGSAPGPHLVRCCPQPTVKTGAPTKRPWTLTPLWTQRTRPQRLGNLAEEREIPTAPTAMLFFLQKRRTKNSYGDDCPDLRGFR